MLSHPHQMTQAPDETVKQEALQVLDDLGLEPCEPMRQRLVSGHASSLLMLAEGTGGRRFVLKHYLPTPDRIWPAGVQPQDYARRECGFYRLLDEIDPRRRDFPAPRTVLIGPGDPPRWLLLEHVPMAPGPAREVIASDHCFRLIEKLREFPQDRLVGRRSLPLNHWNPIGYMERVRLMYESVLNVLGERRWRQLQAFFDEAVRWIDSRKAVLVHGDFCEENLVVTEDDEPWLVDFERIGVGNEDHDIAWLWIHSTRDQGWKKNLILRWFGNRVGGDRVRCEWGIRAALAYMAVRRLRWGYLREGEDDPRQSSNLALLDATLAGGSELFPV